MMKCRFIIHKKVRLIKNTALMVVGLFTIQMHSARAQMTVIDPSNIAQDSITAGATTTTAAATTAEAVGWTLEWPQLNGLLANLNSSLHLNLTGSTNVQAGLTQATLAGIDRTLTVPQIGQAAADSTASATSPFGCAIYAANYHTNAASIISGIDTILGQLLIERGQGSGGGTPAALRVTQVIKRCGRSYNFGNPFVSSGCTATQ